MNDGIPVKKLTLEEMIKTKSEILKLSFEINDKMVSIKNKCEKINNYLFTDIYKIIIEHRTYRIELEKYEIEKLNKKINEKLWKYFIDMTRLFEFSSRKNIENIIKQLEDNPIEFTIESASSLIKDMKNKYIDTLQNLVKEVYKHFIGIKHYGTTWKDGTKINNAQKIEKIFRCSEPIKWESYFKRFDKYYYKSPMFNELEKICFLLDNKDIPRYPNTIEDQINKTDIHNNKISNEYFEVVLYKNGNQKVNFLRQDILDKINKIGGGINRDVIAGIEKKYKERKLYE